MIICIASGKGGTGKTTVATNLAVSLGNGVQLLDCDVEQPNAHLFLKPEITVSEKITTPVPEVDTDKCDYCGKCGEICQFSAITVVAEYVLTFPELCHSCEGCMMVCPQGAISKANRELGVLEKGKSGSVDFVHGRMRITEAMSPPLIEAVKEQMDTDKIVILDAPPGTSCPVITTLKGSDVAVLVTEPTPFGLNDLRLAVGAVRTLEIPMGIVINRCDAGDDGVLRYAEAENIPVLMEIPDEREIAEAYSRGVMMVDAFPEMKEKFRDLYEEIGRLVE
jgi:MinD superfamily P-loop ATPase